MQTKMKRVKSLAGVAVAVVMLLSMFVVGNATEEQVLRYEDDPFFIVDFETQDTTTEYSTGTESDGGSRGASMQIDFLNWNTNLMYTSEAISGDVSLALRDFADMRIWTRTYESQDGYIVELKVKVATFVADSYLGVSLTDEAIKDKTANEGEGGMIWRIVPKEGSKFRLINAASEEIMEIDANTVYTITVFFEAESNKYNFYVNGTKVEGKESTWVGDLTTINAARIDLRGTGSDVVIDDFLVSSEYLSKATTATATPTASDTTPDPSASTTTDTTATAEATSAATATATATATPKDDADDGDGLSTTTIILIVVGVVVVAGVVVAIVMVSKKKKK